MFDTYDAVLTSMEESKPDLIKLLEAHIDLESLIPEGFYRAFYKSTGREHSYHLVSFLWFFILKKLFSHRVGVTDDPDSQLLEGTARPLRL